MFKVKLSNIQKVKPEFKKSDIEAVRFFQCVGNGQRADIIQLACGEVIQVTADGLMLFSNEFGYLDIENSLLASYPCYNSQARDSYYFNIEDDAADATPKTPEEWTLSDEELDDIEESLKEEE